MAEKDITLKEQIAFIKELSNRLDEKQCDTQLKADAKRIRRELQILINMSSIEYRWGKIDKYGNVIKEK